jgi:hypothetical protein
MSTASTLQIAWRRAVGRRSGGPIGPRRASPAAPVAAYRTRRGPSRFIFLGVLAYVFWHIPVSGVADYEQRLAAFHDALRRERPTGLGLTATVGLDAIPWLGGAAGYEDWYLVEDFSTLGLLNAAAVSGGRRAPHDAAAEAAQNGAAGLMRHIAGPLFPELPGWAAWLGKPAGVAYDAFHAELWEALGKATEYCVVAPAEHELPWPAQSWPLRIVVGPGD